VKYQKTKLALGVASAMCAAAVTAAPAQAAALTDTEHSTFDATGATFNCLSGPLTVTSGVVDQVMHFTLDNTGVGHYTGTLVPHGVTLTDAQGNTYTLSGASWFGGSGTDPNSPIVATDTEHFLIRNATGGVYAKVQIVDHISPNGKSFTLDMGSCQPPAG
jgi:hypothetical protein